MSKLANMQEATSRFVHDGDTVVMEGFTHWIPFAAGHELIRKRRTDPTQERRILRQELTAEAAAK